MSLVCPSFLADYCQPVNDYCERTAHGLLAEPLNAITNAAFLVAAVLLWRLQSRTGNPSVAISTRFLAVLIGIIGLGSALFHTVANEWTRWADVVPILVFMLSYCWLVLTVFFGWSWMTKFIFIALYLAATFSIEFNYQTLANVLTPRLAGNSQLAQTIAGGAFYLPTIVLLLGFGTAMLFKSVAAGGAFYAATAMFLFSYTMRSIDGFACQTLPFGTHFLWHICNATVLYLLVRVLILHAPKSAEAPAR